MKKIRVLIVEEHSLVRSALRSLLQDMPGVKAVAETAGEEHEIHALIRVHHPDVVLFGMVPIHKSSLDGYQFIGDVPSARIIVYSLYGSEMLGTELLRAGAAGYLNKEALPQELEQALKAVAGGQTYFRTASYKQPTSDQQRRKQRANRTLQVLTSRQREVLQLVVEGYSTKEIGKKLNISIRTVETHRFQLMDRLGMRNLVSLVRLAIQSGLVESKD